MNKQRRKQLSDIVDRIAKLKTSLELLAGERDDIASDLETLRDEEQDAFDNMPEGLQQSENGQNVEEAADNLTNALDDLNGIDFEPDFDSITSNIDDARGQ